MGFLALRSVRFFSRPRSDGWPHHGRTFSIYLCPLSFWLTLPRTVLSTSWCCPSRPCVVFLAFVHLALFLALSFSPGNSLVSSWCRHSKLTLASLLWQCLKQFPLYSSFVKSALICFLCCSWNPQNLSQSFHLKGVKTRFFILFDSPAFTAARCPGLPGSASTRKINPSGFYWSKKQWVAVASAGPYASLHLAPDRQPHQHLTTQFFLQAGCPSCHPTNSVKHILWVKLSEMFATMIFLKYALLASYWLYGHFHEPTDWILFK